LIIPSKSLRSSVSAQTINAASFILNALFPVIDIIGKIFEESKHPHAENEKFTSGAADINSGKEGVPASPPPCYKIVPRG
jgi:hypothetical protein